MPYCPRCGVETDSSVRNCPLCSTLIPELEGLPPGEPAWPSEHGSGPAKTYATSGQRRARAFGAVASVLAIAAAVVTVADLMTTGALTWSRWSTASLSALLAMVGAVLAWPRRAFVWGTLWGLITAALLAALDAYDPPADWFLPLGLPLTALTFGLILGFGALVSRIRLGYNLLGLIYGAAALELLGIDALISAWTGTPGLGWSLITSLALVPLSLLFFLFHAVLKRPVDLKRIFHF